MRLRSGALVASLAMTCLSIGLASWTGQTLAAEAPAHAFVGVEKCKMCHNTPAKGAQYAQWAKSKHAQAYQILGTEEAKKVGATKGIADPQNAPECLRCHVTGHGAPADKLTQKYRKEDGVTCESCHGPGADYMKLEVMKDQQKSIAAGMVIPSEKTCLGCHNPENPTHKGFDFKVNYPKISHVNPQKKSAP